MRRFWIMVLTLILITGFTTNCFAAQIEDVDPSHWAYKNVKMLVDKGFFSLYEDSTFRGDKSVTRYQLAEIIAKILANLGTGNVAASEGDIKTIRELAVELRKELVDVVQKQNLLTEEVTQLKKNHIVIKEDIARSQQQVLEIIDQLIALKDLEQKYNEATTDREKIKAQIAELEKKMTEGMSDSLEELNTQITEIKGTNKSNAEAIAILQEENKELKAEIEDLNAKNTRMIYYIIGGILIALLIR